MLSGGPIRVGLDEESDSALERAHDAVIRYPRFRELQSMISECIELSKIAGEPQCYSITGVTGSGKTTLIRDLERKYPQSETKDGILVPFLFMETPSPVTVKGMAAAILHKLGDPAADRGSLWSMNYRLINLIPACGVMNVLLDDFQNLIDPDTDKVLGTVSNWLKVLIKETGVPFGVIGTKESEEDLVGKILDSNAQLRRLFAWREALEPFKWNLSSEVSIQEFSHFTRSVEKAVEVQLTMDLPRLELLSRIHYATGGVVANIMNLLRYAALKAKERNAAEIDLSLLSLAFRRRISAQLPKEQNPFDEKWGLKFTPSGDRPIVTDIAVGERSKKRKPRRQRSVSVGNQRKQSEKRHSDVLPLISSSTTG